MVFWSFVCGNMSCYSFSARELSSHQLCVPDPPTHNIVFSENSQDLPPSSQPPLKVRKELSSYEISVFFCVYTYECMLALGLESICL